MNSLTKDVEGRIAKHSAEKEQSGKKRHAYIAKFKVQVIEACDEEGATQSIVAVKFGSSQLQVSQWMVKRRDIKDIKEDAASKRRKHFKKGRKSEKNVELYIKL